MKFTPHQSAYTVRLTFGPFRERSLGEVAQLKPQYLEWMAGASSIPDNWRIAAAKTLLGEEIKEFVAPPKLEIPKVGAIRLFPVTSRRFGIILAREKQEEFKAAIDGVVWDKTREVLTFPVPQIVRVVSYFGGPSKVEVHEKVREAYKAEKARTARLREIAARLESDIDVPTSLPLRGDQKVLIEFWEAAGRRILNTDAPGNGKTPTAIGAGLRAGGKSVCVVPLNVKTQWGEQVKKFTGKNAALWTKEGPVGPKNAQFHIVHYDILDKVAKALNKIKPTNLFVDEAVMVTNYKTIRYKALWGSNDEPHVYPGIKHDNVMLLTGEPIKNKPRELFSLLSNVDEDRFVNPKRFIERYESGPEDDPFQNLDELFDRASELMLGRDKSVRKGHKPERYNMLIDMTDEEYARYAKYLAQMLHRWGTTNPSAAQMHGLRDFLFDIKWNRIIQFIDELVGAKRSVLVFTQRRNHAERIAANYNRLGRFVHGGVDIERRDIIKQELITGKAKVGCYTLATGGMGMDGLQETISDTIFVDRSFVPSDHTQAEARTDRTGQLSVPQMWYPTVTRSHEEILQRLNERKQTMTDQVTKGKTKAQSQFERRMTESLFKDFVNQLALENNVKLLAPIDEEEGE
jgi:SNF2 family DNA or RNA helicase